MRAQVDYWLIFQPRNKELQVIMGQKWARPLDCPGRHPGESRGPEASCHVGLKSLNSGARRNGGKIHRLWQDFALDAGG